MLYCVRNINFPILAVYLYIALVTHTVPIQYLGVVHITYFVSMSVVFVTHTVPVWYNSVAVMTHFHIFSPSAVLGMRYPRWTFSGTCSRNWRSASSPWWSTWITRGGLSRDSTSCPTQFYWPCSADLMTSSLSDLTSSKCTCRDLLTFMWEVRLKNVRWGCMVILNLWNFKSPFACDLSGWDSHHLMNTVSVVKLET